AHRGERGGAGRGAAAIPRRDGDDARAAGAAARPPGRHVRRPFRTGGLAMSPHEPEPTPVGPDGKPLAEQPAWRRDFPIDWPEDHYIARRDFTRFLGLTSLAFVVGQLWILLQSWFGRGRGGPSAECVARLAAANPGACLPDRAVGGAIVFHYPDEHDPCLLLRPTRGPLVAFDQKCTHLSCAVVVDKDQPERLHCPCHHGYFDAVSGRPLAGPPRRPLPRIRLRVRDDVVYAVGVERRTT